MKEAFGGPEHGLEGGDQLGGRPGVAAQACAGGDASGTASARCCSCYDENMRYVSSTLTPGVEPAQAGPALRRPGRGQAADRLRAGRHRLPPQGPQPVDPEENIRYSYSWIKGAAGPASQQQVEKFTRALRQRPRGGGRPRQAARRRLHRHQHDPRVREGGPDVDRRHDADDGGAGHQEPRRDQGVRRSSASICDSLHYKFTHFIKPGMTENEVAAFGFE